MKSQVSNSRNLFTWKCLAIVGGLLLMFVHCQFSAAQAKSGWDIVLDEEFNEKNVADLFGSNGLWYTMAGGYSPHGIGVEYDVPATPWNPAGCDNPKTPTTSLTNNGTLTLTVRNEPGKYADWRFPKATLTANSPVLTNVSDTSLLATGNPVSDHLGYIPSGTTILSVNSANNQITLSKAVTKSVYADGINDSAGIVACAPYDFTGAVLWSQKQYLYGYFEISAKIPNNGQYIWPAFWLWGAPPYREIDIFEFGAHRDKPNQNDYPMWTTEYLEQTLDNGYQNKDIWYAQNDPQHQHPINLYAGYSSIQTNPPPPLLPLDISHTFQRYGMKWSPNSVIWYVNDVPAYVVLGHAPKDYMALIVDNSLNPNEGYGRTDGQPAKGDPLHLLPADFEIDYVRAYRSQYKEFIGEWGNGGKSQIGSGSTQDRYISGKLLGNGRSQLLGFSNVGSAAMMNFNGSSWDTSWSSKYGLPGWSAQSGDKYVVGDFAKLGWEQVLAINTSSGKAQLMSYSASGWSTLSTITGKMDWWYISSEDQYVAGDFDGDGVAELLATNYRTGYAMLMKFYGGSWHTVWATGSRFIGGWRIDIGDKYLSGNFDGKGPSGLLAIAANGDNHAALLKFSSGQWYNVWDNTANGKIHYWYMSPSDQYLAGNFYGSKQDQLLAISTSGWSQLMQYSGPDWDTPWANDGAATIDHWYMSPSDRYLAGDFNGLSQKDLFAISTTGWAHLIQAIFTPLPH